MAAAADDAERLRVVIDQVAQLTDSPRWRGTSGSSVRELRPSGGAA